MRLRRVFPLLAVTAGSAVIALLACTEKGGEPQGATSPPPSPTPSAPPPLLVYGSSERGTIAHAGEVDLWTFDVTSADELVELDLDAESIRPGGGFDGSRLDARFTLYGPDGSLQRVVADGTTVGYPGYPVAPATPNPLSMRDPFLDFKPSVAGTWTLAVDDQNGAGGATGYDYLLRASLPVPQPFDGGDTCATATLLTNLDESISSFIPQGATDSAAGTFTPCLGGVAPGPDVDYRAFLTSGQKVQIVRTGEFPGGAIWDGAIYLFQTCGGGTPDVNPGCLIGGDGSDEADGIVFSPAVTGTYFLMVDSATAPGADQPFRLEMRTFPAGQ